MAAIVQQSTQEVSAARAFWNGKMQEHPNLAGALAIALEIAGFFLNGHFLVKLGQWVVLTCGRIAEKGMLFAVLWLTSDYIAYDFFAHLLGGTATTLSVFSLLALTILPEVILYSAVITTLRHALAFIRNRRDYAALSWAVLYGIPTLAFACMTVGMLYQLAVSHYHFQQAGDITLVIRVLAGWFFSLVTLIHAAIGNRHETTVNQAQPVAHAPDAATIDYEEIARQLLPLVEQLQQLRADLEGLTQRITQPSETINETESETNITSFEDAKFHLSQKIDETEMETEEVLTPRVTSKLTQEKSAAKREAKRETRIETNNDRGAGRQKALRVLKRTPDINAAELAKRAGITPQYAGQILKQQSVN